MPIDSKPERDGKGGSLSGRMRPIAHPDDRSFKVIAVRCGSKGRNRLEMR